MNKYELVVITNGSHSESERKAVIDQVVAAIDKVEGKVINSDIWIEKQKMTFPIKKCGEGSYTLLNVELKTSVLPKLRRTLALNDAVLRTLFIQLESKVAAQ